MDALEKLRAADLGGALADLQAEVRRNPADATRRVFLFQLLAITGQWERALNQLNVAGDLDAGTLIMVQTYREALRCEVLRQEVFAGRRAPLIMGEPERWIALALEALRLDAQGQHAQAGELRAEAFEAAPAVSGQVDGHVFGWIADADSRIGPFLEIIVNGNFYWAPFHRISRLSLEPPVDLRDLVWAPAQVTWANGGQSVALVPARYVATADQGDDRLRLSRMTEWREVGADVFAGFGQRVLATDGDEYSLLEIREIRLDAPPAASGLPEGVNG